MKGKTGSGLEAGKGPRFGIPLLEELAGIGTGIVTLRSRELGLNGRIISNLLARNFIKGKSILYLHWFDYHSRFWTLDLDHVLRIARDNKEDTEELLKNVFCIRAFSKDQIETEESWKRIFNFGKEINLVILDSVSELYEPSGNLKGYLNFRASFKNQLYSIGNFRELCSRNDCMGVAFDTGKGEINPYLGEISSVVIEARVKGDYLNLRLVKHPLRESGDFSVMLFRDPQTTLLGWS